MQNLKIAKRERAKPYTYNKAERSREKRKEDAFIVLGNGTRYVKSYDRSYAHFMSFLASFLVMKGSYEVGIRANRQ